MSFADRLDIEVIPGGLPSVGRNAGARRAVTRFVLFIDADMELKDSTLLRRAMELAERRGLHCVTTNIWCSQGTVRDQYMQAAQSIRSQSERDRAFGTQRGASRKTIVERIRNHGAGRAVRGRAAFVKPAVDRVHRVVDIGQTCAARRQQTGQGAVGQFQQALDRAVVDAEGRRRQCAQHGRRDAKHLDVARNQHIVCGAL